MRTERDSLGGYVAQGAAMGVGAFLGAAVVTIALAFLTKRLPFLVQVLPKPPSGGAP